MELGSGLALLGSAKLIEKLLGPTCEYIGQNIQNLTKKMHENIAKIFVSAENKLGDKINTDGAVPPKVLKSILENGSWCDEELQCEYFGGVLASSRSSISRDDRGAYYSSLISTLTSYQIRAHYLIYHQIHNIFSGQEHNICEASERRKLEIYIPINSFIAAMDFSKEEAANFGALLAHVCFGLSRSGLIENSFLYGPPDSLKEVYQEAKEYGIILQPSQPGVELFMWAYGYGQKPTNDFFDINLNFNSISEIPINAAYQTKQ